MHRNFDLTVTLFLKGAGDMKRLLIVGILVMVVAMASPAMAFQKGTIRLGTGTGLLSSGTGFNSTSIDPDNGGSLDINIVAFDLGYFVTDNVEVDVQYATASIDVEDIDTLGLAGKYYIPMGENSFYVGGGFQTIDYFGLDGDAIFVTGGYNYMLRDYFSIDFSLIIGQGDLDGADFDMNSLGVTYSIYFF
jgi:hypothetical protein